MRIAVDFQVLLYYLFVRLDDPESIAEEQLSWCRELGLKGRIIVAHEGINGTASGLREGAQEYIRRMNAHPAFAATEFKIDDHASHAFRRLSVKVRPEIVTLGEEVDVPEHTGVHLSPAEFRAKLDDPNALILDIRNDYEYEMGHFRGAVRPPIETFKEFPDWLRTQFAEAKNRPVLTYCTGGIRCEKLTALLRLEGFEDVYQLNGGIVTYAKDPEVKGEGFEGDCFMFDDRLSVPVGPAVSKCEKCGTASSRYVNCSNVDCNRLYFLCEDCEASAGLPCKEECAASVRKRIRNERLDPLLRSEGKRLRRQRHRAKVRARATGDGQPHTI